MEVFQSMKDAPLKRCPECGKQKLQRKIGTGAGLIFKGGGFYETDYKRAGGGEGSAQGKDGGSSGDGKEGGSAQAEGSGKSASGESGKGGSAKSGGGEGGGAQSPGSSS
jgi:putative FmdB family regulatory protein